MIDERKEEVLVQIESRAKVASRLRQARREDEETPRKDKRKFRRARWKTLRGRIEVSRLIPRIEFTETIKRRLIEEVKDAVDAVSRVQREADALDRYLDRRSRSASRLKEEEKKNLTKRLKDIRMHVRLMIDELEQTPSVFAAPSRSSSAARRRPNRRRRNWLKPTSALSSDCQE